MISRVDNFVTNYLVWNGNTMRQIMILRYTNPHYIFKIRCCLFCSRLIRIADIVTDYNMTVTHYNSRHHCSCELGKTDCLKSIFLLIYFQRDATLHSWFISGKLLYMFRVVSSPIIRSTYNCIL